MATTISHLRWTTLALPLALGLASCGGGDDDQVAQGTATLVVASGRADMVTSGDALIDVTLSSGVDPTKVSVRLNGVDATSSFKPLNGTSVLRGLVSGLVVGDNTLVVDGAVAASSLALRNHDRAGPVFSGPRQQPFVCQTAQFRVYPGGPLLGAAADEATCSVATRIDYLYRASDNTYKPFDPAASAPADLVQATMKDGATVPHIVRLETGTLNRAIYQTAILHDPRSEAMPTPQGTMKGWNQRLVYPFGGGCGSGWYVQGTSTGGVLVDNILSQGYALASASLNVFGTNCNDVVSAETVMMVKERIVESFGTPRHTIGWSCSGAAMQQYLIGNNYPGLLDGIIPSCSFPDPSNPASSDGRLLHNYFNFARTVPWTQQELAAASGFWGYNHVVNLNTVWASRLDTVPNRPNGYTSALFKPEVPTALRYHPVTNRTGARPTHWDATVNAFGKDASTGFARRAMDNVGVQYGLGALNNGSITKAQFLDLNDKIGGFDIDGGVIAQRTVGDPIGISLAYETGRIMLAGGGLASMPIIDWDQIDTEEAAGGDLHLKFFHYMTRARLAKANGSAANMVMWNGGSLDPTFVGLQALAKMDDWLVRIGSDALAGSRRDKVMRNKPVDLVDGCWTRTAPAAPLSFIAEPQFLGTRGTSACNSLNPGYSYPRGVAGEPAASDVIKCQLRPINAGDYRVTFTAAELTRLTAIFPQGVCDYTKAGVEQKALAGTWLRYTGPGAYVRDGAP